MKFLQITTMDLMPFFALPVNLKKCYGKGKVRCSLWKLASVAAECHRTIIGSKFSRERERESECLRTFDVKRYTIYKKFRQALVSYRSAEYMPQDQGWGILPWGHQMEEEWRLCVNHVCDFTCCLLNIYLWSLILETPIVEKLKYLWFCMINISC